MDTIKIVIDISEEITINGEYTAKGPFELTWFPKNNLIIEKDGKKVVINTDNTVAGGVYKITDGVMRSLIVAVA